MIEVQPELANLGHSLAWMAHDEFVSLGPTWNAKAARDAMLDVIKSTGWQGSREMFSVPMVGEGYVRQRWQEG